MVSDSPTPASSREVAYFDYGVTDEFSRDPVTPLRALARSGGPIVRGHVDNGMIDFGSVSLSNVMLLPEDHDVFMALDYDAVHEICTDNVRFATGAAYQRSMGHSFGKTLFTLDPPEHPHYRRIVSRAFTAKNVNDVWMGLHVRPVIDRNVGRVTALDEPELVLDFAMSYPFEVIASITGVPTEQGDRLAQLVIDSLRIAVDREQGLKSLNDMNEFFLDVVENHRRTPRPDMTSALIDAEVDGERLTNEEICIFLRNLIAAGLDTTYRGTASTLYNLVTRPDDLEAVCSDRSLVPMAVEESLRVSPPGGFSPRMALVDSEVCGVTIPAGSGIVICWLAANYDDRRWPDPFTFRLHRQDRRHLTFGVGTHACLGMSLARAEMCYAVDQVLTHMPGLRPDLSRWNGTEMRGIWLRTPNRVPVTWDRHSGIAGASSPTRSPSARGT